jgi:hypothetical protein
MADVDLDRQQFASDEGPLLLQMAHNDGIHTRNHASTRLSRGNRHEICTSVIVPTNDN